MGNIGVIDLKWASEGLGPTDLMSKACELRTGPQTPALNGGGHLGAGICRVQDGDEGPRTPILYEWE